MIPPAYTYYCIKVQVFGISSIKNSQSVDVNNNKNIIAAIVSSIVFVVNSIITQATIMKSENGIMNMLNIFMAIVGPF